MPGLIVWKNQEINKLRKDMDRLFDRVWCEFCAPPAPGAVRMSPSLDLTETEDALVLKAEIPGINPEDLEISITEDILTIRGEMQQELTDDNENFYRTEKRYGSFTRTVQLPCRVEVDDIEATYKKEILTIQMPKCKPEETRQVKIRVK